MNKKIIIESHLRYVVFYWSLTNQTWDGLLLCTSIWITHSLTFWHLHLRLNDHITYLLLWGSLSQIFGAILWEFFFTINIIILIGITTKNVRFCHLILPWLPSIVLVLAKSKMFKTHEPKLVIKKITKKWIYNLLLILIIQTIHKGKIIEHVIQSTLLNVGLQIGVVFVVCCPWDVASSHPME